jgi:ABC-type uncharacterized transport system permease subunit
MGCCYWGAAWGTNCFGNSFPQMVSKFVGRKQQKTNSGNFWESECWSLKVGSRRTPRAKGSPPVLQWRTSCGVGFSNLTSPKPDSKPILVVGTQMSSIFTTKQGSQFGIGLCKFGILSNGKSSSVYIKLF